MNNQFIEKSMWTEVYLAHTDSCYHTEGIDECYNIEGRAERGRAVREAISKQMERGNYCLLPYRLSILKGIKMANVSQTGRARKPMVAQLKGTFTKGEDSPYKTYKPYNLQTGLWRVEGSQTYYYGSIGLTGMSGGIDRDNGDLVIIHTTDWKTLRVYVFRGLAGTQKQLDYLEDAISYIKQYE